MVNFTPLTDVNISDLGVFYLSLDVNNANTKFSKYGQVTVPISRQVDGDIKHTGNSAWFHFTEKNQLPVDAFKKTIKDSSSFFPNEYFREEVLPKIILGAEEKKVNLAYFKEYANELDDKHEWIYLTDKSFEAERGDSCKLGICFRNGIDTGNALRADLFTFRDKCDNGAIWGREKQISAKVIHVKSAEEMSEMFLDEIQSVFDGMLDVIEYYQEMPKIKFTQKQLDFLLEKQYVSTRYLPDYITVERKNEKKGITETEVKLEGKNHTVWNFFNDMTEAMTKNLDFGKKRISFDSFANSTGLLHSGIVQIIDRSI